MEDEWKQVVLNNTKFPFEVNRFGKIRYCISKEPVQLRDNQGYLVIYYHDEILRLHRLVAHMFIPNDDPDTKTLVHHKNHLTHDNRADNLEWISPSDHSKETYAFHGKFDYDGENNPNNKFTAEDIHKVCKLLQKGKLSCPQIAKKLNIPTHTVKNILTGQNWKCISKDYDFSLHLRAIRHAKETLDYARDALLNHVRPIVAINHIMEMEDMSKVQASGVLTI